MGAVVKMTICLITVSQYNWQIKFVVKPMLNTNNCTSLQCQTRNYLLFHEYKIFQLSFLKICMHSKSECKLKPFTKCLSGHRSRPWCNCVVLLQGILLLMKYQYLVREVFTKGREIVLINTRGITMTNLHKQLAGGM